MSNPDEAIKINRLRKELSKSDNLTSVDDEFHIFEQLTNKHFNKEMNREVYNERAKGTIRKEYANKADDQEGFARIKSSLIGSSDKTTKKSDIHNDWHSNREQWWKYDKYASFSFANRASEVLSPLSKGKFGFTLSKMS